MNLQSLLESAQPLKELQSDAARLASKWSKTGLLEGLANEHDSANMAIILENQAKQLVNESSQTGGGVAGGSFTAGVGGQYAAVALPLVRKIFGQIAAKEFVSVQPMNLPSGLVFYLDFQYGTDKDPFGAGDSMYGNSGSAAFPFGNTNSGGLYGAGRFGYSINTTQSIGNATVTASGSAMSWSDFNFDDNFSSSFANYAKLAVTLPASTDFNAVRAFTITSGSTLTVANNLPAFTTYSGTTATFIVPTSSLNNAIPATHPNTAVSFSLAPADNTRGDFEDGNTTLNGLNNPISIPEINVQLRSEAIVAKTRKLKAVWTPEFAQDLNAYHALDAEAELTGVMSEYISLEIDLEILDMLIQNANAATEVWSARNNEVYDGTNLVPASSNFFNTQGQWFQTLGTKIQKISNTIHQKTLRGGANFLVCSPRVATIIESIPGYASDSTGDVTKMNYSFGVQKAGAINSAIKVYKNPYMTENQVLVGFRGNQFLEAGAVFAPYIPLIMTPLIYDPTSFTPRKGLLTRYAKKMLRPEFYGRIEISGLNTI